MKQCSNLTILPICCPGVYPDKGRGTFKFQPLIRINNKYVAFIFVDNQQIC